MNDWLLKELKWIESLGLPTMHEITLQAFAMAESARRDGFNYETDKYKMAEDLKRMAQEFKPEPSKPTADQLQVLAIRSAKLQEREPCDQEHEHTDTCYSKDTHKKVNSWMYDRRWRPDGTSTSTAPRRR